jgi:hypothetical protein
MVPMVWNQQSFIVGYLTVNKQEVQEHAGTLTMTIHLQLGDLELESIKYV